MDTVFKKVAIIGAGCWGTALALAFSEGGDDVVLWTLDSCQAKELAETRLNPLFKGGQLPLPSNIEVTTDMEKVVLCDLVVLVVPSSAMRSVAENLLRYQLPKTTPLLSCTKGIEKGSSLRMTEILHEVLPHNLLAVLSGPNHAEEVVRGLPGITVIGSHDHELAANIQHRLSCSWFRAYTSSDVAGMELGGAIKNVFAIAAGICEGLGLGDNATAGLVTRALAEMTRLGIRMGGKPETFTGLSGVGDLMVTCYSHHSRNNTVGRHIAEGMTVDEILSHLGSVAEGVPNAYSIYETAKRLEVRTPLIDTVYAIIYEKKKPLAALEELFQRTLRSELD